jgi:hypothetical protein
MAGQSDTAQNILNYLTGQVAMPHDLAEQQRWYRRHGSLRRILCQGADSWRCHYQRNYGRSHRIVLEVFLRTGS